MYNHTCFDSYLHFRVGNVGSEYAYWLLEGNECYTAGGFPSNPRVCTEQMVCGWLRTGRVIGAPCIDCGHLLRLLWLRSLLWEEQAAPFLGHNVDLDVLVLFHEITNSSSHSFMCEKQKESGWGFAELQTSKNKAK